jgi:hypothetical protein
MSLVDPILAKGLLSGAVREALEADGALAECVARGLANLSAVARQIRPYVEAKLGQQVKHQSLVSALKRARHLYAQRERGYLFVLARSSLDVRTDLAKLSVSAKEALSQRLHERLIRHQGAILEMSWGPSALTLVLQRPSFRLVKSVLPREALLEAKEDLAAVIVRSPQEIVETPGCIAALTSKLARAGINLEDVISTYTDTTLVVKMKDVVRAFTLVSELIAFARRALGEGAG